MEWARRVPRPGLPCKAACNRIGNGLPTAPAVVGAGEPIKGYRTRAERSLTNGGAAEDAATGSRPGFGSTRYLAGASGAPVGAPLDSKKQRNSVRC